MSRMQTKRPLLSVIVPCFNEAEYLMGMAKKLALVLDPIVGEGIWQFVFISNGCTDNTKHVLDKILDKWPITINTFLEKPNYGEALKQGLFHAQGKWSLIINVDFWDGDFIAWAWQQRNMYELIIGSKRADPYEVKRPKYRKILSWGLNVILQLGFGLVTTDTHGQKLIHMATLKPILDRTVMRRGQFDTEFVLRSQRSGLKIAEIPVPIVEKRPQRNLMIKKIAQNFFDIYRLKKEIQKSPVTGGIHYHRYSVDDKLKSSQLLIK